MSAARRLKRKSRASGAKVVPSLDRSRGAIALAKEPRAVSIDGAIGDKKNTAAAMREQLGVLGKGDIDVSLNSEGGVITEGMAMYHALRRHDGKVTIRVDGLAASMGSVLLQAGTHRIMAKGSFLMIHNPSLEEIGGESTDLRRAADLLDKMRDELLDIYESRCTGKATRAEIKKLMDEETWLTANEAVKMGFADEVDEGAEAKISLRAVAALDKSKMPEALRAKANGESTMTAEEEKEMRAKLKALEEENAKLKATAEDDESEEEKEESEPHSEDEDDDKDDEEKASAKAVLAAARRITGKRSLAEVEGALMAIGSAHHAGARSAREKEVTELIRAGRMLPRDKAWALSAGKSAYTAFLKGLGDSQVIPLGEKKPGVVPDGAPNPNELTASEVAYQKATGKSADQIIKARAADPMRVVATARIAGAK